MRGDRDFVVFCLQVGLFARNPLNLVAKLVFKAFEGQFCNEKIGQWPDIYQWQFDVGMSRFTAIFYMA